MKKYLILSLLLLGVVACSTDDSHKNRVDLGRIEDMSDIRELIDKQTKPIDANKLISQLSDCTLSLRIEASGEHAFTEYGTKVYRFYEEGYCRLYRMHNGVAADYTRDYNWEYDAENSAIITTDEYGNTSTAEVLYYDGDIMLYYGCLGCECIQIFGKYFGESRDNKYRIVQFIDNNDSLYDGAHSFDIWHNQYIDEKDTRIKFIEQKDAEDIEIDDELFLSHLKNHVFYYDYEFENPTSGAVYGDIGVYHMHESGIMRWLYPSDLVISSGVTYPIVIMMEDGVSRLCDYTPNGVPGYVVRYWSYDAENNILRSGIYSEHDDSGACEAEVIYVDDKIAILKGAVLGNFRDHDDYGWGYFYINFTRFDRESVLNEYNTKLTSDDFDF